MPVRLQPYSIVVDRAVPAKTAGSATTDSLPFAEEVQAVQLLAGLSCGVSFVGVLPCTPPRFLFGALLSG
jgi:hypothetical protein